MTTPSEEIFKDPKKAKEFLEKFRSGMSAEELREAKESVNTAMINSPENPWRKGGSK